MKKTVLKKSKFPFYLAFPKGVTKGEQKTRGKEIKRSSAPNTEKMKLESSSAN